MRRTANSKTCQLARLWRAYQDGDTREMRRVIEASQNGPPDGARDGTISVELWTAVCDWLRAADIAGELETKVTRYFEKDFEDSRVIDRRKP